MWGDLVLCVGVQSIILTSHFPRSNRWSAVYKSTGWVRMKHFLLVGELSLHRVTSCFVSEVHTLSALTTCLHHPPTATPFPLDTVCVLALTLVLCAPTPFREADLSRLRSSACVSRLLFSVVFLTCSKRARSPFSVFLYTDAPVGPSGAVHKSAFLLRFVAVSSEANVHTTTSSTSNFVERMNEYFSYIFLLMCDTYSTLVFSWRNC